MHKEKSNKLKHRKSATTILFILEQTKNYFLLPV